jgi:hypothetical protein
MRQLEQEWKALDAEQATSAVDQDTRRADLLARYEQGLSMREIGACTKVSHVTVVHLLRYHRFLVAMATKVPERRFRDYWLQIRDPLATRKQAADPAYEAENFRRIAHMIKESVPPQRPAKREKQPKPRDVRGIADVRKQARRVYRDKVRPELDALIRLLRCDRATYAPSILSGRAQVLKREILRRRSGHAPRRPAGALRTRAEHARDWCVYQG